MDPELIVTLNRGDPVPGQISLAVPVAPFAQGFDQPFSLADWDLLRRRSRKAGQRLYLLLPGFVMEEQLAQLEKTIKACLDADGIYYGDEAVLMMARSLGYKGCMIFQPDTLVCSSADVLALQSMGADVVSLAHELSLEEVLQIAAGCSGLEVQIHGTYPVLTSRRRLLEAYGQEIGCDAIHSGLYELQESTRTSRLPILQDEAGTTVFAPEAVASANQLPELLAAGLGRFRIDSRFMDPARRDEAIDVYRQILEGKPGHPLGGSDRIWCRKSVKTKGETL